MKIWKNAQVDSGVDWVLVDENNETEIIASITVSIGCSGLCTIDGVCKKIGLNLRVEHMERDKLKTAIYDIKKIIVTEINHLSDKNMKPDNKKIYNMTDGIPMWEHIKNGTEKIKVNLEAKDYGKFAEILGNRILGNILQKGGILDNIFSDIDIIAVHFIRKFKVLEKAKIGLGDVVIEVDYRKDGSFGKKIVIFEIKHGRFKIEQNQLRRYCSMILEPGEYFHKANEVKVIYMIFEELDTVNATAYYSIKEIDKTFAKNVLEMEPVEVYS